MNKHIPENVDEYISWFPEETQLKLATIRDLIKKATPEAEETISYAIPAYKLNGVLIYFAGFTKHISIYPAPRESEAFVEELSNYKGGKGTIQFPLNKPLPVGLIARIINFRIQENLKNMKPKK